MITDVVMPQMGGAKLVGELASDWPDMKILFVSGYAETTVQHHSAIDVTTRFLQKLFSLQALARKIRAVLDTEVPALSASAAPPFSGSPFVPPTPPLSYNCLPES